eukprot:14913301-Alexandrium_andersonii.AAC.1
MPGAGALAHPPAGGSEKMQTRKAERVRAPKRRARASALEGARAIDREIGLATVGLQSIRPTPRPPGSSGSAPRAAELLESIA